jgi:peptide/nickel transport system permease protein
MLRFALARLMMAIPTLLIVAVAVFVLIRLIPGDPAQLLLGDLADPIRLADLRAQLGLDKSWPVQFGIWGTHVLGGDLGVSITTGEPVLQLVMSRFLVSAQIVLVAVFFATLVAVPAGMIAAWKQNRLPDLMLVGTATLLVSIPTFWLGLLLLLLVWPEARMAARGRLCLGHERLEVGPAVSLDAHPHALPA